MHELFSDVISAYRRIDAIADGILIDVTDAARAVGIHYPTALTVAAWHECVAWDPRDAHTTGAMQDERGRLHDVLFMLRVAAGRRGAGDMLSFTVSVIRRGGDSAVPVPQSLRAICGPGDAAAPVITIMLPEESWSLGRR